MQRRGLIPTLTTVVMLAVPCAAFAQTISTKSLSWTERSQMDARSLFAPMLEMMPGTEPATRYTAIHLQGNIIVQEYDGGTSVIDIDDGYVLMVNHGSRTTLRVSLQEAVALTEEALERVSGSLTTGDAGAHLQGMSQAMRESGVQFSFTVTQGSTGRRRQFGPHQASQHWVLVRADGGHAPDGSGAGGIYFICEVWATNDVPTEAELFESWGHALLDNPHFLGLLNTFDDPNDMPVNALLDGWMPGLSEAMVEMLDALGRIGGTFVEESMIIAMGDGSIDLDVSDLDHLAAWENPEGLRLPGIGDLIRGAVGNALGGLMGRRNAPPAASGAPPIAPGTLTPILRLVTTRTNLSYGESDNDVLGTLMDRISEYRVQSLADVMGAATRP